MASLLDNSFEHGNLICEILLLDEKASHQMMTAVVSPRQTSIYVMCPSDHDI